MKKLIIPIVVVLACVVGYFAYSHQDDIIQSDNCTMYHAEDLRLMDLPKDKIDFSPVLSAFFYVRLREGNMPMTFSMSILRTNPLSETDSLSCRIDYKGVKLRVPLEIVKEETQKDGYLYTTQFYYNLSNLLKERGEDEVMEWMKSLPPFPQKIIKSIDVN